MIMTTERDLLRLMTWLSPAFPVGAFGYSHGLETVIGDGVVADGEGLGAWVSGVVAFGAGWTRRGVAERPRGPGVGTIRPRWRTSRNWPWPWRPHWSAGARDVNGARVQFLTAVQAWRPRFTTPSPLTAAEPSEGRGVGAHPCLPG